MRVMIAVRLCVAASAVSAVSVVVIVVLGSVVIDPPLLSSCALSDVPSVSPFDAEPFCVTPVGEPSSSSLEL